MKTFNVNLARTIRATPEQVFDVWIDPKSPASPWAGSERTILNPVVDGLFYFSAHHMGRSWAHYGRFLTLDRGKKIEHTWMSEATKGIDTVVTLTLTATPGGTEVRLTHMNVPDDELGRNHTEGWTMMLAEIAKHLEK